MSEVRLRPFAEQDLVERTNYYRSAGGDELGESFFNEALKTLGLVGQMGGAGSPRLGELCGVPGLRSRGITGFACGWFYFERADHIDVVRLLSYSQDLETILGDKAHD